MEKFIAASLIEEVYREILYVTYHYQEEMIGEKEVKALKDDDYLNLKNSKILPQFFQSFTRLKDDSVMSYIPYEFLKILEEKTYDYESVSYLIDFMNPFVSYYYSLMHGYIDDIIEVLDIKMREKNFKGSYPLYMTVEEKRLFLERAILSTNAKAYLDGTTKIFGLKLTYIDYDIKLENYSYNGIDLRNLKREEILNIMDSSVRINLNNAKYFESELFELKDDERLKSGEVSFFLDKKVQTYSGVKDAIKGTLKRTLITFLILGAVTALILIIKYYF